MTDVAVTANKQVLATSELEEDNQYLTFVVGDECFGLVILCVKEILEYGVVTKIPLVPNYIRGVINLRGSVLPVIDLAARLGRQRRDVTRKSCIIVVEVEHNHEFIDIGVVVDGVSEVLEVKGDNIEPAPSFGANIRQDFISGMCNIKNRFVILLNIDKVLSVDELARLGV